MESAALVSLGAIPELAGIRPDGDGGLAIGSATTLAALAADPGVRADWPALASAAGLVASAQIRKRGSAEPVKKLTGNTAGDLFDRLVAFSAEHGCPVTVEPIDGAANGFYAPRDDRIVIRPGLAPDQAAKTLVHEIAHSQLHRDVDLYLAHRGDMELEAESVSFVVLHHHGIDAGAYSFGYVATWAGGDGEALKGLKICAARIQTTARRIIDAITVPADAAPEPAAIEEHGALAGQAASGMQAG